MQVLLLGQLKSSLVISDNYKAIWLDVFRKIDIGANLSDSGSYVRDNIEARVQLVILVFPVSSVLWILS